MSEPTRTIDEPDPDDAEAAADPEAAEEDIQLERHRFRLSKTLTRRIDQYLVDRLPHLSRASVQRLIEDGLVKVNGRSTKASYKPKAQDVIDLAAPPKPVSELVPEPIPLDIIFEDEHLLVVAKPPGLVVHPGAGNPDRTLQNALKEKVVFDEEKKELIYNLGCVLDQMGRKEEAVEQFKLIYEVDIGYKDVAARVDAYYAGQS